MKPLRKQSLCGMEFENVQKLPQARQGLRHWLLFSLLPHHSSMHHAKVFIQNSLPLKTNFFTYTLNWYLALDLPIAFSFSRFALYCNACFCSVFFSHPWIYTHIILYLLSVIFKFLTKSCASLCLVHMLSTSSAVEENQAHTTFT